MCVLIIFWYYCDPQQKVLAVCGSKIMNSQVVWSCYRWEQLHLKAWKICCKVFMSALGVQTGQHVRQQLIHWLPWHCIQVFWFRIKLPPHWQCLSLTVLTRWLLQSYLKLLLSVSVLCSCLSLSLSPFCWSLGVMYFSFSFFFSFLIKEDQHTFVCGLVTWSFFSGVL